MHADTPDFAARLRNEPPVEPTLVSLAGRRCGLVIVDEQSGFGTVGAGVLAPTEHNAQNHSDGRGNEPLGTPVVERGLPIVGFLDHHEADRPEPPDLPHWIAGSGEQELVPELRWLAEAPRTMLIRADRIMIRRLHRSGERGQQDRRVGSLLLPGYDRRRRHMYGHLRRRIRRDDAVGKGPSYDAGPRGRRRRRAGSRHLRSAEGEGHRPRPPGDGRRSARFRGPPWP